MCLVQITSHKNNYGVKYYDKRTNGNSIYSNRGVCIVDNDKVKQEIEVVHTVPKMTQAERIVAEKRVSSDLFEVLTDIYVKLNIAEEDKKRC